MKTHPRKITLKNEKSGSQHYRPTPDPRPQEPSPSLPLNIPCFLQTSFTSLRLSLCCRYPTPIFLQFSPVMFPPASPYSSCPHHSVPSSQKFSFSDLRLPHSHFASYKIPSEENIENGGGRGRRS